MFSAGYAQMATVDISAKVVGGAINQTESNIIMPSTSSHEDAAHALHQIEGASAP